MSISTQQTFEATTHGATSFVRPWVVAMDFPAGAGSILIEQARGTGWSRIAPAYTASSNEHVVEITKTRRPIRITPSGGATYEVTNE